jgi:hypothetical protein
MTWARSGWAAKLSNEKVSPFPMHQAFQLERPKANGNQATSCGLPWTKAKACARLKVAFKKHIHSLAIRG